MVKIQSVGVIKTSLRSGGGGGGTIMKRTETTNLPFFYYLLQRKYVQQVQEQDTKFIPLTSLNKYLHNDKSETDVNVNTNVYNGRN